MALNVKSWILLTLTLPNTSHSNAEEGRGLSQSHIGQKNHSRPEARAQGSLSHVCCGRTGPAERCVHRYSWGGGSQDDVICFFTSTLGAPAFSPKAGHHYSWPSQAQGVRFGSPCLSRVPGTNTRALSPLHRHVPMSANKKKDVIHCITFFRF